jgi:threonylcarbamoyladenosine tRNA methylthiotransferase MtaB
VKYAVVTFGCRVNQADSLCAEADLLASGAEPAAPEAADLVVVNTCSVTSSADQAARQTIRRIARVNPAARLIVTGCYATRAAPEISILPNVAAVVPNSRKHWLLPIVLSHAPESDVTTAQRFGDGDGACGETIHPGMAGRTAYTLRVQTGCAQPCSYCIIPSTRGVPRSVPSQSLVAAVDRIYAAGYKEIALTGVHLGSYGRDLPANESLFELLSLFARLRAKRWPLLLFRISSLEPMDCSRAIVDLVADGGCFAPHFHLPLQHGSRRVLERMQRPYSLEYYAALVDYIRDRLPNASIGSDLIAGFPGEAASDVDITAEYLRHSPLTHLHVFPYSDRPGTVATALPAKVDPSAIRERAGRLRDVGATLTADFRRAQVGTRHRALTLDDGSLAVTGNYLKVRIPPGHERNEWVTVRVIASGTELQGDLVS